MINNITQEKKINDIQFDNIEKVFKDSKEPEAIVRQRIKHVSQAKEMKFPGKPDEAWRKFDLADVNFKNYAGSLPKITFELMCEKNTKKSPEEEKIYLNTIEEATKERPELFEAFYGKIEESESTELKNKDTVYTSDIDSTLFLALSESLFNTGAFIYVPKFVETKQPVKVTITIDKDNSFIIPQVLVYLEEGSSVDLLVEYYSDSNHNALALGMIKGVLGKGSRLNILNYQSFGKNTVSLQDRYFTLGKDAVLSYDFIQTGSKKSMTQHKHILTDQGAETNTNGVVRASEDQIIGNKVEIHHFSPKTFSDLKLKSVLRDKSRVVFVGNIKMPEIAQKCNGYQSAKNLILGEESRAEVIPRLEIIADDVKCSHGATVGSIDKEELFYLSARGIDQETAESLIVKSYYQDILNNMVLLKKYRCVYEYITERLAEISNFTFDSFSPQNEEIES